MLCTRDRNVEDASFFILRFSLMSPYSQIIARRSRVQIVQPYFDPSSLSYTSIGTLIGFKDEKWWILPVLRHRLLYLWDDNNWKFQPLCTVYCH